MARRKKYIDGIYNYCDRWCERCPLTLRCRVYAMEQQNADSEGADASNAAFWSSIQKVFAQTKDLLQRMARERGVDLDAVDLSNDEQRSYARLRKQTRRHPLVKQGEAYAQLVNQWLEAHEAVFEQKGESLEQQFSLGLDDCDPEEESLAIGDAIEVVRWYQFQIPVKISRGVGSREMEAEDEPDLFEDDSDTEDATVYPSDADGSVKVALLGIDRSLAAWTRLSQLFPEEADSILDLLVHLDRLRRAAEGEFPRAREFVRPGFDAPA